MTEHKNPKKQTKKVGEAVKAAKAVRPTTLGDWMEEIKKEYEKVWDRYPESVKEISKAYKEFALFPKFLMELREKGGVDFSFLADTFSLARRVEDALLDFHLSMKKVAPPVELNVLDTPVLPSKERIQDWEAAARTHDNVVVLKINPKPSDD
jgi:hypothetical protein